MPSSTKRPSISLEELDLVLGPPPPILKDHVRASQIALRRLEREDLIRRRKRIKEYHQKDEDIAAAVSLLKSGRKIKGVKS